MHRKLLIYRIGKASAILGAAVLFLALLAGVKSHPHFVYPITMSTCALVLVGFVCMARARDYSLRQAPVPSKLQ